MIELAGTLTRPANPIQASPAVVLISGTELQDRDQQILGQRPFLVLADYLTRQGFAVLRFDDRGIGKSGSDRKVVTTGGEFPLSVDIT